MKYTQTEAEYFMQAAIAEAQKALVLDEVPIGCVVVKDGRIIGSGYNLREHSHKASDHAELRAIETANQKLDSWRLDNCALFVTLEPCPMCCGAIINSRIEEVYYGAADLKAGMAGTLANWLNDPRLNHTAKVKKGILKEQCSILLQTFFEKARKK